MIEQSEVIKIGKIKVCKNLNILNWEDVVSVINKSSELTDTAKKVLSILIKKGIMKGELNVILDETEIRDIYEDDGQAELYNKILDDSISKLIKLMFVFESKNTYRAKQLVNDINYDKGKCVYEINDWVKKDNLIEFIDFDKVSIELA